jgi:hypothetical protein
MMDEMVESDGKLLVSWLRLLGWVVVVEEREGRWIALARHERAAGEALEVRATAPTHAELAWNLFERALRTLERRRTPQAA